MTCWREVTTSRSQVARSRVSASSAPGMGSTPLRKCSDWKKAWTRSLETSGGHPQIAAK